MARVTPHYSPQTLRAVATLGKLIAIERRSQGRQQRELAERAGIAQGTLIKIEHGNPAASIATVFELATILGIPLFPETNDTVIDQRLALIPARARRRTREGNEGNNDF